MTTKTTARYADLSRLPGPTGAGIQRQMSTLRARLIARYNLITTPGKPEELSRNGRIVSLGYGCGTIRVRRHDVANPREWAEVRDLQVNDGWHAEVYAMLDSHFGWTPHAQLARAILTTPTV